MIETDDMVDAEDVSTQEDDSMADARAEGDHANVDTVDELKVNAVPEAKVDLSTAPDTTSQADEAEHACNDTESDPEYAPEDVQEVTPAPKASRPKRGGRNAKKASKPESKPAVKAKSKVAPETKMQAAPKATAQLRCGVCAQDFKSERTFSRHMLSQKHAKALSLLPPPHVEAAAASDEDVDEHADGVSDERTLDEDAQVDDAEMNANTNNAPAVTNTSAPAVRSSPSSPQTLSLVFAASDTDDDTDATEADTRDVLVTDDEDDGDSAEEDSSAPACPDASVVRSSGERIEPEHDVDTDTDTGAGTGADSPQCAPATATAMPADDSDTEIGAAVKDSGADSEEAVLPSHESQLQSEELCELLDICGQSSIKRWDGVFPANTLQTIAKVGEGTFAEVCNLYMSTDTLLPSRFAVFFGIF